jgi:hypothetical protein
MRIFIARIALVVTCLGAAAFSRAQAADTFPPSLTAYPSSVRAAALPITAPAERTDFAGNFELEDAAAPTTQSYWPLLYSTLVPGLGELTMGYEKRGIALMAAEVVAWTGYYTNHNDGIDERTAYEAFADKNWNFDKWIDDHPSPCVLPGATLEDVEACGRASSGSGAWPGYIPYVSKEQDKQHYYENLGKYDWYISGWADWDGSATVPAHDTTLRTQYRDMRGQSNDSLDKADSFIWISVAARAFSIAETAIIVHRRRGEEAGGGGGSPITLSARPRGRTGGEVALEVRFK